MKTALGKFARSLRSVLGESYKGWRWVGGELKPLFMNVYLPPAILATYFLLNGVMVVVSHHASVVQVVGLAAAGLMSQVSFVLNRRNSDLAIKSQVEAINALSLANDEIVEQAADHKRQMYEYRSLYELSQTKLNVEIRKYDELLQARTDDVIHEVHRRLTGKKTVRHVFKDVPAAPPAPPDVQAPF